MLVSAVLPTRSRKRFAAQALACFLSQTYPEKELVILDDADDPSFDQDPQIEGVRYYRTDRPMNIPQKRNAVNALTRGNLIWHLDSDDWSAPERMAEQVERHLETGKAVTGYHSMFFHDERDGGVVKYEHRPIFALGTSLCYTRAFWKAHPFNEAKATASDGEFVRETIVATTTQDGGRTRRTVDPKHLSSIDGSSFMVARAHSGNTGDKKLYRYGKVTKDLSQLPPGFLAVLDTERECAPVA